MNRAKSAAVALVGAACFIIGAIILAAHPNRRWNEITGEPEAVEIEIESVR